MSLKKRIGFGRMASGATIGMSGENLDNRVFSSSPSESINCRPTKEKT